MHSISLLHLLFAHMVLLTFIGSISCTEDIRTHNVDRNNSNFLLKAYQEKLADLVEQNQKYSPQQTINRNEIVRPDQYRDLPGDERNRNDKHFLEEIKRLKDTQRNEHSGRKSKTGQNHRKDDQRDLEESIINSSRDLNIVKNSYATQLNTNREEVILPRVDKLQQQELKDIKSKIINKIKSHDNKSHDKVIDANIIDVGNPTTNNFEPRIDMKDHQPQLNNNTSKQNEESGFLNPDKPQQSDESYSSIPKGNVVEKLTRTEQTNTSREEANMKAGRRLPVDMNKNAHAGDADVIISNENTIDNILDEEIALKKMILEGREREQSMSTSDSVTLALSGTALVCVILFIIFTVAHWRSTVQALRKESRSIRIRTKSVHNDVRRLTATTNQLARSQSLVHIMNAADDSDSIHSIVDMR